MTTAGTGSSDSSVSRHSSANIITTMPTSIKNCTMTSCVMRRMNACRVAVSPEMRLMTEPVEVLS